MRPNQVAVGGTLASHSWMDKGLPDKKEHRGQRRLL